MLNAQEMALAYAAGYTLAHGQAPTPLLIEWFKELALVQQEGALVTLKKMVMS